MGRNSIFKASIKTKLIAAFLVPVLLLIVQGVISYSNSSSAISDVAMQADLNSISGNGKYLQNVFSLTENEAHQFFESRKNQEYLTDTDETDIINFITTSTRDEIKNQINLIMFTNRYVGNVYLISMEGKSYACLGDNNGKLTLSNIKQTEFYNKVKAMDSEEFWIKDHSELDEIIGYDSSTYSFSRVYKFVDKKTNEIAGMLLIDIKTNFIGQTLTDMKMYESSEIHLISPDLGETSTLAKQEKPISGQGFYANITAGSKKFGSSDIDYNGKNQLLTYTKLDSGFVLLSITPLSDINSAAKKIVMSAIITIIIAALLSIIIGLLISSSMTSEIRKLIAASGRAAEGNLTGQIQSKRKDEFGTLTWSMNVMTVNMRKLIEQMKEISHKVAESANTVMTTSRDVSTVSTEITRTVQEIAQGASAQAGDAEKGVMTIGDLADKVVLVSDNAKLIDKLTQDSMDMTRKGLKSIDDLDEKANQTTVISGEIMKSIKELDQNSKSIGKIVQVINGIADQTNLLALNAAIEAARAGDSGRGFAVVADEVRRLADQSLKAAEEISRIIVKTQSQTAGAVEKAEMTEGILKSQNEAVRNTLDAFNGIRKSMDTLEVQVRQITRLITETEEYKNQALQSIQNISAVTEETAASAEEVNASTEEQLAFIELLAKKAEDLGGASALLEEAVSKFKLE